MGLSIIPLTSEQNFNTTTPSSTEAVVLAGAGLIAHTCPAGKKQKGHAIYIVTAWPGAPTRNLRARVQGVQIKQFNSVDHLVGSDGAQLITPEVSLDAGDTISVTTQNSTTEGGTVRVSFIITNEVSA